VDGKNRFYKKRLIFQRRFIFKTRRYRGETRTKIIIPILGLQIRIDIQIAIWIEVGVHHLTVIG